MASTVKRLGKHARNYESLSRIPLSGFLNIRCRNGKLRGHLVNEGEESRKRWPISTGIQFSQNSQSQTVKFRETIVFSKTLLLTAMAKAKQYCGAGALSLHVRVDHSIQLRLKYFTFF